MYTIESDSVTGINGASYLKGQIVSGDVFVPGAIPELIKIKAISLNVEKKTKE